MSYYNTLIGLPYHTNEWHRLYCICHYSLSVLRSLLYYLYSIYSCSLLAPTVSAPSETAPPVSPDLEVTTSQFEHQTSPVVEGPTDGWWGKSLVGPLIWLLHYKGLFLGTNWTKCALSKIFEEQATFCAKIGVWPCVMLYLR